MNADVWLLSADYIKKNYKHYRYVQKTIPINMVWLITPAILREPRVPDCFFLYIYHNFLLWKPQLSVRPFKIKHYCWVCFCLMCFHQYHSIQLSVKAKPSPSFTNSTTHKYTILKIFYHAKSQKRNCPLKTSRQKTAQSSGHASAISKCFDACVE